MLFKLNQIKPGAKSKVFKTLFRTCVPHITMDSSAKYVIHAVKGTGVKYSAFDAVRATETFISVNLLEKNNNFNLNEIFSNVFAPHSRGYPKRCKLACKTI